MRKKFDILFSAPMVRAVKREIINPGTGKTETRRLAWVGKKHVSFMGDLEPKMHRQFTQRGWRVEKRKDGRTHCDLPNRFQRAKEGDLLWVRETWGTSANFDSKAPNDLPATAPISFCADFLARGGPLGTSPVHALSGINRPAIHLPERFSRISGIVQLVKVERLQAMTDQDAVAEGIFRANKGWAYNDEDDARTFDSPLAAFRALWESIHYRGAWEQDPEVVVVRFRPVMEAITVLQNRRAA